MESLNDIIKSLKKLLSNEARFYSLKGIEKASILLGLLATVFFLGTVVLVAATFATIALAAYLNTLFESTYMGFLVLAGAYILVVIILLLWMKFRKAPLFTNLFIRRLISIINLPDDED